MFRVIYRAVIRIKDTKEKLPCKPTKQKGVLQGNFSLLYFSLMIALYMSHNM